MLANLRMYPILALLNVVREISPSMVDNGTSRRRQPVTGIRLGAIGAYETSWLIGVSRHWMIRPFACFNWVRKAGFTRQDVRFVGASRPLRRRDSDICPPLARTYGIRSVVVFSASCDKGDCAAKEEKNLPGCTSLTNSRANLACFVLVTSTIFIRCAPRYPILKRVRGWPNLRQP